MKKIICFVLTFLLFGFLNAYGADLKIAYIDLNKVVNESDRGKNATKILGEMVSSKQKILAEKEAELKKLREEIDKQSSVLTPESLRDKQDNLNKLNRDLQLMARDFQEELQKKEQELTSGILNDITSIVDNIGKEEGYTIIFEKRESGMLYSNKALDITEKIIKKYNESAKKE